MHTVLTQHETEYNVEELLVLDYVSVCLYVHVYGTQYGIPQGTPPQ